jgi:tetratricopeptide (TPR) repeat protein
MAVDELRKAIELDPQCAEAYLDLADVFKTSVASHSQAITCYARAIECGKEVLPPRDLTRAYWELGEIYRQQKKWKEASLSFREVYQREPEFNLHLRDRVLEAYKAFANEIERAHPAAALTVAEEGLKVRYDSELALKQGKLLNQLEEYERSNEVLSELLQGDPRTKMAHYYRALNFLGSSELLQCREALQREIAINPDNFDALILLGDLALQRDDYEPAQTFYGRAQAVQPDNPLASLGLCKAHRMKGELEKAKDAAKEVLARFPEDREANLEMGRILVAEEDYEDARTFFTNVLDLIEKAPPEEKATLDRLQADALLARGEIALLTAGPGTANKDFRRALEVLPDYGQAYYSIGIAYRKKFASTKQVSDLKTAEENIQKSRELTPENPQFALQLGILYSQELAQADPANRKVYLDKAVKNWESYIELGGANTSQVRRWIDEIKGGGNATTEQAKADS